MNTYNNIIITATNSLYYDSLLTLISSIHKTMLNDIDQIYVYNLGLSYNEITNLNKLKKVTVLEFSEEDKNSHPKFLEPKSYVYKIHCMYHSYKLAKNILWIDSGAMLLRSAKCIFDIIKETGMFLVGDVHKNKNFTHADCIRIMRATDEEINDNQIWAGLVGYNSQHRQLLIIQEAYKFSMIPGCLDGNQENHRHDQSILSILASRYKIKKYDIDIYGYWTDSTRNINTAISNNSIVFAHRRGYLDHSSLLYNI